MSEPLHVAFVWHMHQPCYRSAQTGIFEMPWVRMHALKDYLDMVETLGAYPRLHQNFNLVPSLVEQLEEYAGGGFRDVYWDHTLKPADDLDLADRTFVVERMCERPDHPRARAHPRYLELAQKREAQASQGWEACASAFTVAEFRDLQVWFNLAWFDPQALEAEPLADLVRRGREFSEEDKQLIAQAQAEILSRTLPAYRDAARRGQIEISTSPYFHPILPLLANSDSARIAAGGTLLPPRRFAHPEDAAEQIRNAMVKHEGVFGEPPRGMWCSEQAVGEDVIPLLIDAGVAWTISDETVLARSLSGTAVSRLAGTGGAWDYSGLKASPSNHHDLPGQTTPGTAAGISSGPLPAHVLHAPYRLEREQGQVAIVFRDHTLSDLIGFAYRSWASRDAAADLLRRLREIRTDLASPSRPASSPVRAGARSLASHRAQMPLVTIALDGENAWEYYPRDGRDFLHYLYQGLSNDPAFRCVTISEHLRESPPTRSLGWLHTGSWIGGDLCTWSGDRGHNAAWDLLHQARDLAASRRRSSPRVSPVASPPEIDDPVASAWHHILVAEGSDWFWWFGDHHHTELDYIWDLNFRRHLQEVYHLLGEPVPLPLYQPLLETAPSAPAALPRGPIAPVIDGILGTGSDGLAIEWNVAGFLAPELPSTMQPAEATKIREVRFGWHGGRLCLLVIPGDPALLPGLDIEVRVTSFAGEDDPVVHLTLEEKGEIEVSCVRCSFLTAAVEAAWKDVLEIALPLDTMVISTGDRSGLVLRIGRSGLTEHVFHTAGLASLGWREE